MYGSSLTPFPTVPGKEVEVLVSEKQPIDHQCLTDPYVHGRILLRKKASDINIVHQHLSTVRYGRIQPGNYGKT